MNPIGLIIIGAGIFSICGAVFDWDWFINSRKARFLVATFGRNGARIFYGVLGILIAMLGLLITLGVLKNARPMRRRFSSLAIVAEHSRHPGEEIKLVGIETGAPTWLSNYTSHDWCRTECWAGVVRNQTNSNLRSSRETGLLDEFPAHAVAKWMGHDPKVSLKHYAQTTEDHFERAAGGTESGTARCGRIQREDTHRGAT